MNFMKKPSILSHSKLSFLLVLMFCIVQISVVSSISYSEVANETFDFNGNIDLSSIETNITSKVNEGILRSVSLQRGGSSGWSRYRVNISQNGLTLASKTTLVSGIGPYPTTFINFTVDDYSSIITKGLFTLHVDRENGSVVITSNNSDLSYDGSLFNFTDGILPAGAGKPNFMFTQLSGFGSSVITPSSPALRGSDINVSSFETNGSAELKNVTMYINGIVNETVLVSGALDHTIFSNKLTELGNTNVSFVTCNNESVCITDTNTTITVQDYLNIRTYAPSNTSEGNLETLSTEFNLSDGVTISSANLVYNGTVYSTSINNLGSGVTNLSTTLTIPSVITATLHEFYFNITLSTGLDVNSTNTTLGVSEVDIGSCSAFNNVLYNFTVYNEKTLAKLSGASDFVNGSITIDLYDSAHSNLIESYSVARNNINPFAICLEETLVEASNYSIDLQIQYGASGYATEFYNILNDELTVADLNTNISLYSLDNLSSQQFTIIYKDSSFLPVSGAIIQVQRKYIGEGIFRTVEQPKTDANGETLAHLETNDAIYNFVVLVDGVVDATFNNVVAVCQNPTFDVCSISLTNVGSYVEPTDFSKINDLSFNGPTYNKETREIATTFSITSGTVSTMVMNVTLFDGLGTTTVCSSTVTSSSGELRCTVPTSFGNTTVVSTLYQDGEKKAQAIINLNQDPSEIYGTNIVWVALVIFLSLLGMGVTGNPIITGFFLIISMVILVAMNVFYSTGWIGAGSTILWFIIAVVLLMIKGARKT